MNLLILFVLIIGCYSIQVEDDFDDTRIVRDGTLQQVHVVFRHGDRTPDQFSLYPKDPHINDTWYPEGYGQLTLNGKMQEYNIGRTLRKRYNNFLGRIYTPDVIEPLSTDYNRTKMSLELVLAGLYPPAASQIWNIALPWQPIPYNYVSWQSDPVMKFALFYCQKYIDLYNEANNADLFQNFMKSNAEIIQYISENSGLPMKSVLDVFGMYNILYAELQTGRKLPQWTKKIFPDFVRTAGNLYYELQTYNTELRKYSGGTMLKKILTDARAKKDGTLSPKERKIFLYSGHEYNVAYILGALNVFKPHIPPYGSFVVVEFHKINNVYGFKILHQDYTRATPQYLTIPGCDIFCPFDKLMALADPVLPKDGETC